ncbi:NAD(P)/FAD-dependent oxidoreductase [Algibacillus agarilyticus]|uniref:NAD(P)/FAD-dependent oxidoreductase n=1 Tax=Algibacillus agarilyticus TaxID=2234133 RepID=UPI000DD0684B|nr:FAD-dependent oxidoreductase [Algibacillus agarilyticus]
MNNKQQAAALDIAIIGSGISGLTSAYLLNKKHNVTVFEKNDYIGGHTATIDIEHKQKAYAIDTGFIVFNNKTYPNFLRLLDAIGIKKQETEMSFSVKNKMSGLEYNGHNLDTLFAQRSNLFKPSFWQLIREILRFNKLCKQRYISENYSETLTLGQFLAENKFDDGFAQNYILPMGAAIWSSSLNEMAQFQFKFFVQFFHNHGLLNVSDRPQWYVVPGGSREYIAPLTASFKDNIQLNTHIISITRDETLDEKGVTILFDDGTVKYFDKVVMACHANETLELLADKSLTEYDILQDIPYTPNEVVLHTDEALLPKHKKAWASWNYQLDDDQDRAACVTYNMNILQGIKSESTFCVTLNQTDAIDPSKIIKKFEYWHPVFNCQSLAAQQRKPEINGQQHTYFAGAYWHNGFHEDGVKSAVTVAQLLGCDF